MLKENYEDELHLNKKLEKYDNFYDSKDEQEIFPKNSTENETEKLNRKRKKGKDEEEEEKEEIKKEKKSEELNNEKVLLFSDDENEKQIKDDSSSSSINEDKEIYDENYDEIYDENYDEFNEGQQNDDKYEGFFEDPKTNQYTFQKINLEKSL